MDLRAFIDSHPVEQRKSVCQRLGRAGGVGSGAVRHWANGTRNVPGKAVIAVSKATGGSVLPHELRPDIFPPPAAQPRKRAAGGAARDSA